MPPLRHRRPRPLVPRPRPTFSPPTPTVPCRYCGIHNPESVVKCLTTGKWFCNGRVTGTASCIVTHLVRAKCKEVSLHKDSPLGETVLECYASGSRNVFALGFVPLAGEHTVVLLARDTPPSSPAIKDLDLDLSAWSPLIEDRAFVGWLVRPPEAGEIARARHVSGAAVAALEEAWRRDPTKGLDDLAPPRAEDEPCPVALRYDDAYQYQNIFGPLIKLEAGGDGGDGGWRGWRMAGMGGWGLGVGGVGLGSAGMQCQSFPWSSVVPSFKGAGEGSVTSRMRMDLSSRHGSLNVRKVSQDCSPLPYVHDDGQ